MAKKKRRPLLKFPRRMQKKLIVMFTIVAGMLIGLIGRLMYIEYTSGEKYEKIVLSQQEYDSKVIPYQRGDIVDAKGTVMATSIAVYNVILDCSVLTSDEDYVAPTIQALVQCFPDLSSDELYGYVRNDPQNRYIVLKKKISYDEMQPFVELQDATDEKGRKVNPDIKGVWFEKEYQREYPYGSLASAVIGFTASGNVGVNGLENYYNSTLNGINGREFGYLNTDNNFEKTIKQATNGNNIVTTIDANIQSVVEGKIREFNEAYTGAYREGDAGASHIGVLIMDPNNGDVLAMANYPNFDLSNPRDLSAYYTEEELAAMDDDAKMDALNQLWQNFCVSYTYEPGSTAKPFTVAAALESGAITGNEHYQCNGSLEVGGHTIKCHSYRSGGEGDVSVQDSIAWSCNVALMKIAATMGKEEFAKFQQTFNFGLKTNVDLAGEARTASLLFPVDQMGSADLATNSFGQNFNVTMIQMITGFCSLINGGYYYEPHMVDKITNASGATVENIEPRVLRQTISESTSAKIRQYCRATVMEEGGDRRTGRTARPAGYAIGGKTGTAETIPRKNGEYVVSFMGYAPADDPQIAIYVVVDRANASPQDDAKFATGIVRNVLTEVLPYLNIFMTEELSEKEIQELAEKQIEITNQYTQTPENGDDQSTGDNQTGDAQTGDAQTGDDQSGDSQSGDGTGDDTTTVTEDWRNYPKDPATGYLVSPIDGGLIDPITGADVGGDDTMGDSPINNNLLNQQNE